MKIHKITVSLGFALILLQALSFAKGIENISGRTSFPPATINVSIDTVKVLQGNVGKIAVPVKVTGFQNIGAISIKISFDSTRLQFTGISNAPSLAKLNVNNIGNQIIIGWYDATTSSPLTIPDGPFFNLNFNYTGGKAYVDFITSQCELGDALGNTLNVNYINGAVLNITSSVKETSSELKGYSLEQNYPNPFNPITNIEYTTDTESKNKLEVFDLKGDIVAELVNQNQAAGSYKVEFNALSLPSGTYVYKLRAGSFSVSRKMTVLK